ncbi:MAG TPA: hypothetical protein VNN25_12305, partial [Thermoanaerobaculia bacterium]|nr:hypothetical protein [Thermoanaerobaculia bacterium]
LVVPAMLNRLQDLRDVCPRQELCFVLATNYIDNIEPALVRKGRIDAVIPLVYPDRTSRAALVDARLSRLPAWAERSVRPLLTGNQMNRWPYKAIDTLCGAVIAAASATPAPSHESIVAIVKDLLEDGASFGLSPYDSRRLKNIAESQPFRDEVLAYILSGSSSRKEYLNAIASLSTPTSTNADAMTELTTAGQRMWQRLRG